jgi:hypothetical protein
MNNITPIPANVITTQLSLLSMHFYRHEDMLAIIGDYGDLLTGEHEVIRLVTDFETLNNILQAEINEGNETAVEVIDQLAAKLIDAGEDTEEELETWEQILVINSLIFSLATMMETDEDGFLVLPEKDERSYVIRGYAPRKNIIPCFNEELPPASELPRYYRSILAARYAVYLAMTSLYDSDTAGDYAELGDPLIFAMAEQEYKTIAG